MANESRLSITIDSRSAEQQAKDLEKALDALDGAGIRVVNTTDRAGKTTSAAGRTFAAAGREAKQGAGGVDDLNRSLAKTDDQAARTAATLRRVLLAATAGFSAMSVIDTADQWGQYASRIRMATESTEEYDHVQKRMVQSANETYRSIQETREAFINLSPVIRDMGFSLDQSIDAVDAFSGLLVVNGANAERGAAAMSALSKSLQKGKVDADAWMTIYSTADTIVDSLALSTGKTAEEIRALGVAGKITGRQMVEALGGDFARIMGQVREMPTTVRDALQNIGNAFSEYIGWSNEANGITAGMASGLDVLGKNFETVANVVGGIAATALFVYTARTIESTRATIASFAARTREAKATLDNAQAQAISTAATLADARAKLGLTASLAQVTAATKVHELALKQVTIAQAGYTRAGTALLGALGGPVGLIATVGLAAGTFIAMGGASNDAKVSLTELTGTADEAAAAFKKLGTLSRQAALDSLAALQAEQMREASKALTDFVSELEPTTAKGARAVAKMRAGMRNEMTLLVGDVSASGGDLEQAIDGLIGKWVEQGIITQSQAVEYRNLAVAMAQSRDAANQTGQRWSELSEQGRQLDAAARGAAGGVQALNSAMSFSTEGDKYLAQIQGRVKALQDGGDPIKIATRWIGEHADATEADKIAIMSAAHAESALIKAREAAGKSAKGAAKDLDSLLKSLRDQASVLGMTEQQAARYRIETAKGTDAQRKEALALLDKVQAHKAAEQATKLHTESMREQRNLAAEIAVFQNQQNLEITGMGMGDRRRQQLEQEYSIQEEFARRRRELDEAQLTESTRMSDEAYRQQIEYLRSAEEQKIGIIREAADQKLIAEQSWITGAQEGLRNYSNEAADAYSQVADFAGSSAKSAEDALVGLFTGAKTGTREMVNSMLADLARLAIRQSITGPLSGALGGIVGSLFGPLAGVTPLAGMDLNSTLGGSFASTTFSSLLAGKRANGGPVGAGKMYEVNERGTPELLNIGKRQLLMMGPDGGHVTPLDSGASNKPSSQGGGPVIRIESVVNAAPGTNVAELSAMLDQRDRQLEANIYENMRRGRWNT